MASTPKTINEEAGLGPNWVPLDGPPLVPGQTVAAPPASDSIPTNPKYIQGTIAPNFQHDTSFTDTATMSIRAPKFDLMPLGPQQNAVSATQISSTVRSTVAAIPPAPPAASADDDTIKLNLQTGTSYTVQQSDLNKLISISNAAGGTIFLPPVAGTTSVAVTNEVNTPFNSGNTVITGISAPFTATSTYVLTATKAINPGDFLFLGIRLLGGPSSVTMGDNHNGGWTGVTIGTIYLFSIRNTATIPAGGTLTLTLVAIYPSVANNPLENVVFSMTGLKAATGLAKSSAFSSGSTMSSGGITCSVPTTFISIGDSENGDITPLTPANSQGKVWTNLGGGSDTTATFNYLSNIASGFVNDVYTLTASGNPVNDILQSFTQAQPSDVAGLGADFFCYVENTGAGTFDLVSSAPIDGSAAPLPLAQNQGTLLVWDATSQAWYTERGMSSGGVDLDFYQTVQQAGTSKPQESKLNFLAPVTAADNSGNGSTDITVPNFVGDSGSGGVNGLVPAPGAGDAAAGKFLKASGSFVIPPTMVGDSGSGGTAGYVPAPPAGSNAAGDFLSAGGTFVNPGTNPASFNTGLAYAIAAGYALG